MALGIELLYLQDSLTFKRAAESFPSNRLDGAPAGEDAMLEEDRSSHLDNRMIPASRSLYRPALPHYNSFVIY